MADKECRDLLLVGHDLGWKLADAVFREWRLDRDDEMMGLKIEQTLRRFADRAGHLHEELWPFGGDKLPELIPVDVAFLAYCNLPLKIAIAWAEANGAEGLHPNRDEASEIIRNAWREHVRHSRDNQEQFDSDVSRLALIVTSYKRGLVAASVLPSHFNQPDNPLPDRPGMKSAVAIAAAFSQGTRGYNGTVGIAGMEKWLHRFRQARSESTDQRDPLFLQLNQTTLQLEIAADPIKQALDKLPKKQGRPPGTANW